MARFRHLSSYQAYVFFVFLVIGVLLFPLELKLHAAPAPPAVGGVLPDLTVTTPESSEERQYLGLKGTGKFSITDIKARVVILEIFSLYCPYCQREAPNVNRLYRTIQSNDSLKEDIKIVGIGAGNSSFEVGAYRIKYRVPFPLFPDPEFEAHAALGKVRTPYFIAVKITSDGFHRVIYSRLGSIKDPEKFLAMIQAHFPVK